MPHDSIQPVESPSTLPMILGIDGGGTKTIAWLARTNKEFEPEILGRGQAGSSNVMAMGLEAATANLRRAVQAAWNDSGLSPHSVDSAVFALSGAGLQNVQEQISQWAINGQITQEIEVIHDAQAVLLAGTTDNRGVALISGTGSVAMGLNTEGKTTITGGWGYWFGDEGSAFAIGQAALRAIAKADDGRSSTTLLTELILDRLGVQQSRELLAALFSIGEARYGIASLAKEVSQAANQGDEVSLEILRVAAQDLAELAATTAKKLTLGNRFPLALAGGVLCGSEIVRNEILQELDKKSLEPSSLELVPNPVTGCVRKALMDIG